MCSSTCPAVALASATPSPLDISASTCEVRSRYSLLRCHAAEALFDLPAPLPRSTRPGGADLRPAPPPAAIAPAAARNLLHVIAKRRRRRHAPRRSMRLLQQSRLRPASPSHCESSPSSDLPDSANARATACEATGSPVAMYSSMMAVSTSRSRGLSRTSGIVPIPRHFRPISPPEPALRKPPRLALSPVGHPSSIVGCASATATTIVFSTICRETGRSLASQV